MSDTNTPADGVQTPGRPVYDTAQDGLAIISDGTPGGQVAALAATLRQVMGERDQLRKQLADRASVSHITDDMDAKVERVAHEVYESWRKTANRDAYVGDAIRAAAREGVAVGCAAATAGAPVSLVQATDHAEPSVSGVTDEMLESAALAVGGFLLAVDEDQVEGDGHTICREGARRILSAALAGCTVVPNAPEHDEQQWQVTVSVPMRLDGEARQELFNAVVAAVANWEPDDRDGWDADVYGNPAHPPNLADQLNEWADILTRGTGLVPAVDVAWKLRQLADGRAGGSQVGGQHG